jgi:hypothetical protein
MQDGEEQKKVKNLMSVVYEVDPSVFSQEEEIPMKKAKLDMDTPSTSTSTGLYKGNDRTESENSGDDEPTRLMQSMWFK